MEDLSSLANTIDHENTDNFQKTALGVFLMNFYVGVENIIKRVSKDYYLTTPKGNSWHKELLELSYNPPMGKIPVFDKNIIDKLSPYRGFRHVFVSGYGFKLRFELMVSLIDNIDTLWIDIKNAIKEFCGKV